MSKSKDPPIEAREVECDGRQYRVLKSLDSITILKPGGELVAKSPANHLPPHESFQAMDASFWRDWIRRCLGEGQ